MAYLIERTTFNGYRCSCCRRDRTSSRWTDDLEEALAEVPRSFPVETEWGGIISVKVIDGSSQETVAESRVSFAPSYQRGDAYKYTGWTCLHPEEAEFISVIIKGRNMAPDEDDPEGVHSQVAVVDLDWSDVCNELREADRLRRQQQAQRELEAAKRKLASLS